MTSGKFVYQQPSGEHFAIFELVFECIEGLDLVQWAMNLLTPSLLRCSLLIKNLTPGSAYTDKRFPFHDAQTRDDQVVQWY